MMYVLFFLIILYLLVIGSLILGFDKVKDFHLRDLEPKTAFSIIIPFRNEEQNVQCLLNSLSKLKYPKHLFEILMIDDGSSDNSRSVIKKQLGNRDVQEFSKTIMIVDSIPVSNAPKKDAITSGIAKARHPWVVTTDADCIVPPYWLDALDEIIQTNMPDSVVAPVKFTGLSSFLTRFQILDILSLQGATIGGFGLNKPFLNNGANFAYKKTAFNAVDGFKGNDHIASGDDVFLMQKFLKSKLKVSYLKSEYAIVTTIVVPTFQKLIEQRIRWVSKTTKMKNNWGTIIGLIIVLTNLMIIALIPLSIFGFLSLKTVWFIFLIKFAIDLLLIFKSARFFNQEGALLSFPFASFLYPFFGVYVGVLSVFKSYQWKGRHFKT